jgi:hypothetical protein
MKFIVSLPFKTGKIRLQLQGDTSGRQTVVTFLVWFYSGRTWLLFEMNKQKLAGKRKNIMLG